jgi:hypothetical protein
MVQKAKEALVCPTLKAFLEVINSQDSLVTTTSSWGFWDGENMNLGILGGKQNRDSVENAAGRQ